MKYRNWHATKTGKKHSRNEDSLYCNLEQCVFAVADGMSGNSGDVASQLATEVIGVCFSEGEIPHSSDARSAYLLETIQAANFVISKQSATRPDCIGMGTTLTCLWLGDSRYDVGHVGDSRCYLFREGVCTSLTEVHARDTDISGQKVKQLSRALGLSLALEVDVQSGDVYKNDLFLVMSDGVGDYFSAEELAGYCRADSDNIQRLTNRLMELAIIRGSTDDLSIVAVQVES